MEKITVPMGVIRHHLSKLVRNVTSDAAVLCLMAGSAVILRGGKEAFRSNNAIAEVLRDAIESAASRATAFSLYRIPPARPVWSSWA